MKSVPSVVLIVIGKKLFKSIPELSMTVKQLLKHTMTIGDRLVLPFFDDLSDAPLERTLENDGPHAHWILGHLLVSEVHMIRAFAMGAKNPYEQYMEYFGNDPDPDGKGYPPYDQLLDEFRQERAHSKSVLEGMPEDELDETPVVLPDGYEEFIPTKATCFMETSHHLFSHRGQLADIRRRLGREILMY